MNYSEQLKSPMWQKKRLEIMQRDNFTCKRCLCNNKTLNVHHVRYLKNKKAWEYKDSNYLTLCEDCHSIEHYINNIFNVDFIRFTSNCIFNNSFCIDKEYMNEMGLSFKQKYTDFKTTSEIYLSDDVLTFDAIKRFTTYVFCNFYIDNENEIIYIDQFFDAKY